MCPILRHKFPVSVEQKKRNIPFIFGINEAFSLSGIDKGYTQGGKTLC